ncbi:uncharacterized protein LOC132258500 [Phlebotomus argentipes]|uniref:uncharacterized protein LOC132258500 n=1 Tax=Phlebotomus argentipes TaxID=94469 RepID=UPI002892DD6D|nr:uncharacterized protein LOC132258500 [Phlebotomus argentipes]
MKSYAAIFAVFIIACTQNPSVLVNGDVGDDCRYEKTKSPGVCKLVFDCQEAIADITQGVPLTQCGWQGFVQIVCCPKPASQAATTQKPPTQPVQNTPTDVGSANLRKSEAKCREYARFVFENVESEVSLPGREPEIVKTDTCGFKVIPLIVGGENATEREFPHMALVGYGDNINSLNWNCGGSLISENFVLTAAHCVFSREFGYATYVRLGELNYAINTDKAQPVDIAIKDRIKHPKYTVRYNYHDIALFRLQKSATFNRYVRPICLSDRRNIKEKKAIASGWGYKEFSGEKSSALQKVILEFFSQSECFSLYSSPPSIELNKGIEEASQLCAGSHTEEKDTCNGDSGGPLQVYNLDVYCMYTIVGLTSFGKGCGFIGTPTVYTRVANYIDWIENIVWTFNTQSSSDTSLHRIATHQLIILTVHNNCFPTLSHVLANLHFTAVRLVPQKMHKFKLISCGLNILLLISVFNNYCVSAQSDCSVGESCTHKTTNERGVAKRVFDCPSAIEDLKNGKTPSGCGFESLTQIVCCPADQPAQLPVEPVAIPDRVSIPNRNERVALRKCREYGEYAFENVTIEVSLPGSPDIVRRVNKCGFSVIPLIVGGTLAGAREFPHMALIGFEDNPILWKCGGTLISEKFVLTAGHCLSSQDYGPAKWIRVGDLNYESEEDDARPENVRIKRPIPFPTYVRRTQYNDLALLELERAVKLSPYVRPACLYTEYKTNTEKAIATGWGRVEWAGDTSSNLLKVTLELFTHRECNTSFQYDINRKLSKGIVDESQLCAGSHSEEKDTCEGDSGGPLQIYNNDVFCMYNVIGVTSFGKGCGAVNQPGVYTRVSNYIDWIEQQVWPNQ